MEQPNFVASDGVRLLLHEWPAREAERGVVLVIHGVAEHGGRYAAFASRLANAGLHVVAFDHRGHGLSEGPRVHVDRWDRYLTDAEELVARTVREHPNAPLFVYGHSMGALIALGLAIRRARATGHQLEAVRGWIVSGAGIEPAGIAKPHLVAIARLLSGIAPRVRLDIGLAPDAMSHDTRVVAAYRDDPLVQRRATVRWGMEALGAIEDIREAATSISDPLMVIHGGADTLALPAGSEWLAGAVGQGATLRIYEGAFHEPHNDEAFGDVAADIAAWIDSHV